MRKLAHHFQPPHFSKLGVATITVLVLVVGIVTVYLSPLRQSITRNFIDHLANNTKTTKSLIRVCNLRPTPPAHYDHIIWIMEENKSLDQVIGKATAPFLTSLADNCGYSTNFTDSEPDSQFGQGYHSLVHYLAMAAGSNCVVGNTKTGQNCLFNDYKNPRLVALPSQSIFSQLLAANLSWRSYQESAPSDCSVKTTKYYVPRHDAALYFSNIAPFCPLLDVSLPHLVDEPTGALISDIRHNSLPTLAYVTPDLSHDMHNGTVGQADAWLQSYLEPLFASATYKQGKTAVFIVWDEAKAHQPIANLFIAPSVRSGAVSQPMSGFAVLRATEDMLGLPYLGCATGQPPGGVGQCYDGATTDLRQAFNL